MLFCTFFVVGLWNCTFLLFYCVEVVELIICFVICKLPCEFSEKFSTGVGIPMGMGNPRGWGRGHKCPCLTGQKRGRGFLVIAGIGMEIIPPPRCPCYWWLYISFLMEPHVSMQKDLICPMTLCAILITYVW